MSLEPVVVGHQKAETTALSPQYETVGDAYVVAVNLQRPEPQHPLVALRIAVSMVALAAQVDKADGSGKLKIRVGMHTGPVAGGVIGTRRTLLTLCGDTLVSGHTMAGRTGRCRGDESDSAGPWTVGERQ